MEIESKLSSQRQMYASPMDLLKMLKPWKTAKSLARHVPLTFPPPTLVIHRCLFDRVGRPLPTRVSAGKWSVKLQQCNINVLESMAVLLNLEKFKPNQGCHIPLRRDNSSVAHCLNR